jgi:hypothetical protein
MSTPPTLISVFNLSAKISDSDVEKAVLAIGRQLADHFIPLWGPAPALEFVAKVGKGTSGGCRFTIEDIPDQDGVLGYHWSDQNGAQGKVFVNPIFDNGGSALSGSLSVSAVLSHEILELTGNAAANLWADGPGGIDYGREMCDAVEGDAYIIDGVSVSNFVTQAFFDPNAEVGSRFDYMGKLGRAFSMDVGGYQITRTEPGKIDQVFGAVEGAASALTASHRHHVHFGPAMPEWRKPGILWKVARRYGIAS